MAEIGTNAAIVAGGDLWGVTMDFTKNMVGGSVNELQIRILRHLLGLLRLLDMPSSDTRLPRVFRSLGPVTALAVVFLDHRPEAVSSCTSRYRWATNRLGCPFV